MLLLLLLLFVTFSALVANPKKTTLHGGQSRSWSAEQGKKKKERSLAAMCNGRDKRTELRAAMGEGASKILDA